jgi:putative endonuclease
VNPRKSTSRTGARGEELAAHHLLDSGFEILERNWRAGRTGELDIIALDGQTLVVVEVKTATSRAFGDPVTWVSRAKQRQLASLANAYLATYEGTCENVRFDVVAIRLTQQEPEIQHLRDAFRIM